jgi:hypothetical protein
MQMFAPQEKSALHMEESHTAQTSTYLTQNPVQGAFSHFLINNVGQPKEELAFSGQGKKLKRRYIFNFFTVYNA